MTPEKELWQTFAENRRGYRVIDFPRYDENNKPMCGKICLRTLLMNELTKLDMAIVEEVDNTFKNESKSFGENSSVMLERYKDRESNIRAEHYLQQIIVHPDNKDKLIFPTPQHVSSSISLPEALRIMHEFAILQEGRPQFASLDKERFNEWIEALAKSAEEDQLSFLERLEPRTQTSFTAHLVNQLSNLRSLNSSLITQLNNSVSNTTE